MSVGCGTRTIGFLGSIGSVLALFTAAAAPCCLSIFAAFAGAVGLTALGLNEQFVLYAVQGFALVAVVGLVFAVSKHSQFGPLILGAMATLALFFSFHARFYALVVYFGLAGLCAASVWNYRLSRKAKRHEADVTLKSVITCPTCGHRAEETMPTNACLFFYDCSACGAKLKPKPGDCCVFCSFGSVPCPPVQQGANRPKRSPILPVRETGAAHCGEFRALIETAV
jgi:hypothetical protein